MTWENQTEKENIQAGEDKVIQEGNELIMKFDGWELKSFQTFDPEHNTQNPGSNTYYAYVKNGHAVRPEDIAFDIVYHQSWDALMPVVEKIADKITGCIVKIQFGYGYSECSIGNNVISMKDIGMINEATPIETVWLAVIQFIKWYNSQLKAENK